MRIVLALMAILGLIVGPVTATAAQVACGHEAPAARAPMEMAGMARSATMAPTGDPCCDHGSKHSMDQKTCALACTAACASMAALAGPIVGSLLVFSTAQLTPAPVMPPHPYEPEGLIRPPKSMA